MLKGSKMGRYVEREILEGWSRQLLDKVSFKNIVG